MSWEKPCSRCRILIKQGDPNIYLERASQEETDFLSWVPFAKVWHKSCYDQDLEDGEFSN